MKSHPELLRRGGFTLVELLVVLAIIIILIGILIPVVSHVQKSARTATVQNQLNTMVAEIENYHGDQGSYPGPLTDDQVYNVNGSGVAITASPSSPLTGFDTALATTDKITQAENLVLGMCGGLINTSSGIVYDPTLVGTGPNALGTMPKKYPAYADAKNLSWNAVNGKRTGHFKDDAGVAGDSIIPEFVDEFSDPMPILYLRAHDGAQGTSPGAGDPLVNVIQDTSAGMPAVNPNQEYDLKDILAYTQPHDATGKYSASGSYIGVGRSARVSTTNLPLGVTMTSGIPHGLQTINSPLSAGGKISTLNKTPPTGRTYMYPYDAYAYFEDPSNRYDATNKTPGLPRAKDRYILISAGADRTYGTEDDICSFGALFP